MHYDIVENPLEKTICSGRLAVPTAPGLGVTLNHKAAFDQIMEAMAGIESLARSDRDVYFIM